MKNLYKLLGIAALALAMVFSFAVCSNPASGGKAEDETEINDEKHRVDKEVRDLFFYSYDGVTKEFSWDTGTVGGVCQDYACEFCCRYTGEVYLVTQEVPEFGAIWSTVERLPDGTYAIRQVRGKTGCGWRYDPNGRRDPNDPDLTIITYDGFLRDADFIYKAGEAWTESTHKDAVLHAWCVVVEQGKWYLVDPTWRDTASTKEYPIKEIPVPNWAKNNGAGSGAGSGTAVFRMIEIKSMPATVYDVYRTKGASLIAVPEGTAENNLSINIIAYDSLPAHLIVYLPVNTLAFRLMNSDGSLWGGSVKYDLWLIDGPANPQIATEIYKASSVEISGKITTVDFSKFVTP